jgi:hypothetical protein
MAAENQAWEFVMTETGLWEWRVVEAASRQELRRSAVSFETLMQCVGDAAEHGYDRRAPREDRRSRC